MAAGKPLRIVIQNINPFLYNYRMSVDRTSTTGATPAAFLKASGLGLGIPEFVDPPTDRQAASTLNVEGRRAFAWGPIEEEAFCLAEVPDADEALAQSISDSMRLDRKHVEALRESFAETATLVRQEVDRASSAVAERTGELYQSTATAGELQTSAAAALRLVDGLEDFLSERLVASRATLGAYSAASRDLAARATEAASSFPKCPRLALAAAAARSLAADSAPQ